MKTRDSSMPETEYWNSFFNAPKLIETMFLNTRLQGNILELGSGYGTFTVPASRYTSGKIYALDIEKELIKNLEDYCVTQKINNIVCQEYDFIENTLPFHDKYFEHVMIYNLLHLEDPHYLLHEAKRVLKNNGIISIIHWRNDIITPRGPSLEIRPSTFQCTHWLKEVGFQKITNLSVEHCAFYHFGIIAYK